MKPEIEAKFLNVDVEQVRQQLQQAGAVLVHPMRLMRREIFDHPDGRYKKAGHVERLRIRDEGNAVTMTYKRKIAGSNYVDEVETAIGSYEHTKQILEAIGLKPQSYQESKRETWQLSEVEVVVDEWPWAKPYVEIEGPTEQAIQLAAKTLGFDWQKAKFGSVDTVYRAEYPKMSSADSIGDIAMVVFDTPLPQYLKDRQA
ncbi:MAG: class IV adenylate cyclase [Candidatus Saccharimonadales bacterium]